MAKHLIKHLGPNVDLYRDTSGIAYVTNGNTGMVHTCHPNIDASGSVRGMKKLGYWKKEDRTVRAIGSIYNIDKLVIDDDLDSITNEYCQCGGKHDKGRKNLEGLGVDLLYCYGCMILVETIQGDCSICGSKLA